MKRPKDMEIMDFIRNSKPKRGELPRRPQSQAEEAADTE
jgi:hypothetical protein